MPHPLKTNAGRSAKPDLWVAKADQRFMHALEDIADSFTKANKT